MSSDSFTVSRRGVAYLVLEVFLVEIADRLVKPVFDLVASVLASEVPASSTMLLGSAGLVAIIAATILGVILIQRFLRWKKATSEVTPKQEPKSAMPRHVESGTAIIPSGEPLIITSKLLAGLEFYPSRKELSQQSPLEDFLESAKSEVDLLGFSVENISIQNRDSILRLLSEGEGKQVRFILLDPESKQVDELEKILLSPFDLHAAIRRSIDGLIDMRHSLSDIARPRLDIRTHNLLPAYGLMVIDGRSEAAVMQVEYPVYGTNSKAWPSLQISNKEQPELFARYWQSYEYVHDQSIIILD